MATSAFGWTVIYGRLLDVSGAMQEPCVEKSNMADDVLWYKDMRGIYGLNVNERYAKYRMYE